VPRMSWAFSSARTTTSVRRLVVDDVAAQAAVNLTCAGTGCPFSSTRNVTGVMCRGKPCTATSKQRRRRRTVDVTSLFARASLSAGVRLTVSVTASTAIGRVWVFTIRAGKAPSHRAGCLEPGSAVPDSGCKP